MTHQRLGNALILTGLAILLVTVPLAAAQLTAPDPTASLPPGRAVCYLFGDHDGSGIIGDNATEISCWHVDVNNSWTPIP